jgi:ATP-dependent protease ClpP protease subunit
MGAVLFQAGDERIIDARAKLLIHQGSSQFAGRMSQGEAEDYAEFMKMLLDDLLEILAERSTLTKRQIANKWNRKDWWIKADDAVKFGFADRVE